MGNTVRVFETFRHIIIKNTAQHTAAEPKAVFNVPSEKLLTVNSKIFIDGHDISASRYTDSRFLELKIFFLVNISVCMILDFFLIKLFC